MTVISIYSKLGEKVNELSIKDNLQYVEGRISVTDKEVYYKGTGLPYRQHFSYFSGGSHILREIRHPYLRYLVVDPLFKGKFGIFQERYHPIYSEFIGSCGKREENLIRYSREFGRSDVEVLDYCIFDKLKHQGYYQVLYKSKRLSYLDFGFPEVLYELLKFMLEEGWNFPWDKDSISDVTYKGNITDVADLFKSFEQSHQLGTIYSILHSLAIRSTTKYIDFIEYIECNVGYTFNMPMVALNLLERFNRDTSVFGYLRGKTLKNVFKALISGRNCGYGEYKEYGDNMKKQYLVDFNLTGKIVRTL